jgi:hypothetical protein
MPRVISVGTVAAAAVLSVGAAAALAAPASANPTSVNPAVPVPTASAAASASSLTAAAAVARPMAVPHAVAAEAVCRGLSVQVFATGTATVSQPDDIAAYGADVLIGWQNRVGADGTPGPGGVTHSTLTEQTPSGTVRHSWSLVGHIDGLAADPGTGQILATVNEDAHSSLYVIRPAAAAAGQVRHYRYNLPDTPQGGTDAVSLYHGQILITGSNPVIAPGKVGGTAPAVYKATLAGDTAVLQPVFFDNSPATVANLNDAQHGKTVPLALTDPDSNAVVPAASPRFGGEFMLDSQADSEQVYVAGADGNLPQLSLLKLSQRVNDTAWVTNPHGTLYVTDNADSEVFTVRGAFTPGAAYTAVTPRSTVPTEPNPPNYLGVLNMNTGVVTPAITTIQAEGLLFTP